MVNGFTRYKEILKIKQAIKEIYYENGYITSTKLKQKMGYKTPTNLYKLMDAGDELERSIMKKPQKISSISIASALAGVFSGFARPVKRAAEIYGVDPRDIFKILGERRIIVGQEDMVFEIAMELAKLKKKKP